MSLTECVLLHLWAHVAALCLTFLVRRGKSREASQGQPRHEEGGELDIPHHVCYAILCQARYLHCLHQDIRFL